MQQLGAAEAPSLKTLIFGKSENLFLGFLEIKRAKRRERPLLVILWGRTKDTKSWQRRVKFIHFFSPHPSFVMTSMEIDRAEEKKKNSAYPPPAGGLEFEDDPLRLALVAADDLAATSPAAAESSYLAIVNDDSARTDDLAAKGAEVKSVRAARHSAC